jgi:hypothetical protein
MAKKVEDFLLDRIKDDFLIANNYKRKLSHKTLDEKLILIADLLKDFNFGYRQYVLEKLNALQAASQELKTDGN